MPKMICVPLPCKFRLASFLVKLALKISVFISEKTRGRRSWQERMKGRNKLSLFTDEMIVYLQNPKEATKKKKNPRTNK